MNDDSFAYQGKRGGGFVKLGPFAYTGSQTSPQFLKREAPISTSHQLKAFISIDHFTLSLRFSEYQNILHKKAITSLMTLQEAVLIQMLSL